MLRALGLAALASILWTCAASASAVPMAPQAVFRGGSGWPAWREHLLTLTHQDAGGALSQLRQRYEWARECGDPHAERIELAWLARQALRLDHAQGAPWLMLAEQALQAAQREGDQEGAFELLITTESARSEQAPGALRLERLAQAEAIARELGTPERLGLVHQLRGQADEQRGQPGEAMAHYRQALQWLHHPLDRADVLILLARTALQQQGLAGAAMAEGHLAALQAAQPPGQDLLLVDALLLRAQIQIRQARTADAVASALQAVALARQLGLATPVARAQVALGQAYAAAASPTQALAHLQAVNLDDLSLSDQLDALGTRALALAQQHDGQGLAVLDEGRRLLSGAPLAPNLVRWRFHEVASRVRSDLGDHEAAWRELATASTALAAMADTTRDKLVQARLEAAQGSAATSLDARHERALLGGLVALLLVVSSLASLVVWHGSQARRAARRARAREQANERLHTLNTARMRHLASACHDLRQPAQVVAQVADAALLDAEAEAATRGSPCHAVARCSASLNDRLAALQDLSVLAQGRYTPHLAPVRLGELLAEVDAQYGHLARDKGLTWQVGTSTESVWADRHLLRRVLFHLASNAVGHSPQGGVQIMASAVGDRVSVEVADTGTGLPVQQLLGAPGDAGAPIASNPWEGGSGLAIVREATRLMGHELSVPLSSLRGSVVRLTLPRPPVPALPGDGAAPVLARPSVAIVEADPALRQAAIEALETSGCRAEGHPSLAAFADAAGSGHTEAPCALVVTLEGDLPQGLQALQASATRAGVPAVPVLALTADLRLEGLLQAADRGVHIAWLPLSPPRLAALVQELLSHRLPPTASAPGSREARASAPPADGARHTARAA